MTHPSNNAASGQGLLVFFTGKMAAGKSTLCAGLQARMPDAIRLAEDDWLAGLYPGEITDLSGYAMRSRRLRATLGPHIVQLLGQGLTVLLDFPANTVPQRAWMRSLVDASGANHVLHYVECSDAQCKAQLRQRVAAQPERAATDTEAMFEAVTRHFVPPAEDEGFIVQHHIA